MQHEILESIPLLDEKGNLTEPGWARHLLPVYRRDQIKAGKMRIKEWDYYLITNGRFGLALTIADNSYMGLDSISFLNFEEGWEVTTSPMRILTRGKTGLPESSAAGNTDITGSHQMLHIRRNSGIKRIGIFQDQGRPLPVVDNLQTAMQSTEQRTEIYSSISYRNLKFLSPRALP